MDNSAQHTTYPSLCDLVEGHNYANRQLDGNVEILRELIDQITNPNTSESPESEELPKDRGKPALIARDMKNANLEQQRLVEMLEVEISRLQAAL